MPPDAVPGDSEEEVPKPAKRGGYGCRHVCSGLMPGVERMLYPAILFSLGTSKTITTTFAQACAATIKRSIWKVSCGEVFEIQPEIVPKHRPATSRFEEFVSFGTVSVNDEAERTSNLTDMSWLL